MGNRPSTMKAWLLPPSFRVRSCISPKWVTNTAGPGALGDGAPCEETAVRSAWSQSAYSYRATAIPSSLFLASRIPLRQVKMQLLLRNSKCQLSSGRTSLGFLKARQRTEDLGISRSSPAISRPPTTVPPHTHAPATAHALACQRPGVPGLISSA